jgi:hypothetical protein
MIVGESCKLSFAKSDQVRFVEDGKRLSVDVEILHEYIKLGSNILIDLR